MKLLKKFGIRLKLSIAIVLMYAIFFGIGYIAVDNLNKQKDAISILDKNIIVQNGVNEIKGLMLEDLKLVDNIIIKETENDLDQIMNRHLLFVNQIRDTISDLERIDLEIVSRISDSWNNYTNSVLPLYKDLQNFKSKEIIYLNLPDSIVKVDNRIKNTLVDIRSSIYTNTENILAKLTGIEREIKAKLGNSIVENKISTTEKKWSLLAINVIAIVVSLILMILFIKFIFKAIDKIRANVSKLAVGDIPEQMNLNAKDEFGEISGNINTFVENVKKVALYLDRVGDGDVNIEYEPLGENDHLGKAFLKMNENLKKTQDAANKMREQEALQNWATVGVAQFGEILRRQTSSNQELAYNIIKALIEYLDANQGGLFMMNDDEGDPLLELMATYAYGRRKFKQRTLQVGEGLVGTCALEAKTIYMTNIPDDYIEIESYLGHANPKSLLLVPLKLDDKIFGIIEIASFNEFKGHEIKFIEDLAETIASTLATAKINAKTAELLEKSREQSEALLSQEEEMRQNLEELQSTQEEADRRERMLQEELDSTKKELENMRFELNEIKRKNK